MWAVTPEFLEVIKKGHRIETVCSYTNPGGQAREFTIDSGSVSVDNASNSRRTAKLTVTGDSADFTAMSVPGTVFRISHGLRLGNEPYLVPVFTGEMKKGSQAYGGGTISIPLVDLSVWLVRCGFTKPYSPAAALPRVEAIKEIVLGARPGTTIVNTSSDTGLVGIKQVWSGTRWDAIRDLARDGRTEAFFLPDGTFAIRDKATTLSAAVWATTGVLKSLERTRHSDALVNTIIVRRVHAKEQPWSQQTAAITALADPRHPNYIGVIPKIIDAPTPRTASEAMAVAISARDTLLGVPETLSFESLSNPALEGGDVIRVNAPASGLAPADTFQHFIDGFDINLKSGAMSATTRSQVVVDA